MSAQPQNTSEWRWFKHETRVWSLGYIVSTTPGVLNDDTIFDLWESTEDSSNSGVYRVKANATYPVDATHLEDLPDAARMNDLHEAPLLALLERRYNVGSIYTYTGDILISINPCVAVLFRCCAGSRVRALLLPDDVPHHSQPLSADMD